jgi:RNA polymerase sigma-70 factor (ECF subfamily)
MLRLAQGNDASLNAIMARHGERMFHYLIRVLQNEGDAADLAQETFARVYTHRARFDPGQRFSSWLYAIATNLARDRLRWRSRRPEVSLDAPCTESGSDHGQVLPDPGQSPAQNAEAVERERLVRAAVASLPEELRVPLVLAEFEEQSQAEVAAVLGCTVKAVEMRLYRARLQLRERLAGILG